MPCSELEVAIRGAEKDPRTKAFEIKRIFVGKRKHDILHLLRSLTSNTSQALAQKRLPSRMGKRYADIVESCLTCLDKENPDFGDEEEFKDEDGVLVCSMCVDDLKYHKTELPQVGVRYIEKVCTYRVVLCTC